MCLKKTIEQLSNAIVHVTYSYEKDTVSPGILIADTFQVSEWDKKIYKENGDEIIFLYRDKQVLKQTEASLARKAVYRYIIDGEPIVRKKMTANGEVSYIENAEQKYERSSYEGTLEFEVGSEELLLGLGQYEDGVFDYRDRTEYLYESNMRIAFPFMITTNHYAIFIDSESNMIYSGERNTITFSVDTISHLSYYIILGETIDEILKNFQELTGQASMLPRWAFGYVQSKERYHSSQELLEVADEFRRRRIPIDCIVQDWYSWNEGLWGEKKFDKKRYPDLAKTVTDLHEKNMKFMVSVWPNMSPDSENYKEFAEAGKLLPNSNVYDAYDESARNLYFKQCREEILAAGTDAFWCDNAEPFSDADWSGRYKKEEQHRYQVVVEESKKSIEWEQLNSYGLYHAKGIYENWRKTIPNKRIVNLTRSGYISGQKYGTVLWSGDVCAKWKTMKNQIVEGVKAGLCGIPYWTFDIGGFFVVKDKYENRGCNNTSFEPLWFWDGDYNDGIDDLGYRELYTRWLQFGTFLPMFRSHGTDTPREPWQFGDDGEMFYDTIVKFINLRYHLMPYIYSLAAKAHRDAYIMMRSLVFDFANDENARKITDEYMFGDAFLVAPVLEAMYYGAESKKLENSKKEREVYLPGNGKWYDFWTNHVYEGGKTVFVHAPIEKIPLMVKAGAIVPFSKSMQYADQNGGQVEYIRIYEGADGSFDLYNDSGDGYDYEKGEYSLIHMEYCDERKELTFSAVKGSYPTQNVFHVQFVKEDGTIGETEVVYLGKENIKKL